ncbi:hypothetical protein J3B02_001320 [Coemansia erecta]|nr:hypothetical protein J3B02_001320 [Coemansia erecta]
MILNTLRKKSTDAKAGASVHPVTASASTAAADPQQARMLIGFTCKVCSHRQHKTMSKQAYTKGVVLIQCDKCKNRHLIADHLGWFRDTSVTIQDIMREKGESIRQLEDIGLLDNIEAEKQQLAQRARKAQINGTIMRRNLVLRLPFVGSGSEIQAICASRSYSTENRAPSVDTQATISSQVSDDISRIKNKKQSASQSSDKTPVAQDRSSEPTVTVRLSNLPPGTTHTDVIYAIATKRFAASIKLVFFEYDFNLRPMRSCRATFYKVEEAAEFLVHANKSIYVGHTIRAEFVEKTRVPNHTRDKYLGNALGRLVLLYGYPQRMHQHQIRDYFKGYLLVDTNIPAVQPAPQLGHTFLSRRGAFILQFISLSEARRFVRDVHMTWYTSGQESNNNNNNNKRQQIQQGAAPKNSEFCIKALLLT